MSAAPADRRFADADPLDSRLAAAQGQSASNAAWWTSGSHLSLGTTVAPRPGLVLVTLGMAMGPAGLAILSPPLLAAIDPGVSVALAALGVLVGLGLHPGRPGEGRWLVAASLQASLAFLAVAGGVVVTDALVMRVGTTTWMAVFVALCAAASSTSASASQDETVAMRISDLDDVLPVVIGGLALTMLHAGGALASIGLVLAASVVAALVSLAGWLLVGRAATESEQRTVLAGTLLLIGGTAAYVSQSALLLGLVAGLTWNACGGEARDRIVRDLRALQHPLVVLLLIVAGARAVPSTVSLLVAAAYLVWRVVGKLAGGWLVGRWIGREATPGLGLSLVPPGVTGIAFALNVAQADPNAERAGAVLAVVVFGSLASELVTLVATGRRER